MNVASLGALSSMDEASFSLENSLRESQGALHQQRLQRLALQDTVSTLSSYAAAVPLLELAAPLEPRRVTLAIEAGRKTVADYVAECCDAKTSLPQSM